MQRPSRARPLHVMLAVADHFEPAIVPEGSHAFASEEEQERRVANWCRQYPDSIGRWRDADGQPFKHTYFYPAEQYHRGIIQQLADHCRDGWGEVEVHLHHGLDGPDTAENTRRVLSDFRDQLVSHGCLSTWDDNGAPAYAFVHGNWALANSASGRFCGVDEEIQILADTGCYADMTLPSAPHPTQTSKVNALYECSPPLRHRASHRRGRDLERGRRPTIFPLIVQGPLALSFVRSDKGWLRPRVENGELARLSPPTMRRLKQWWNLGIQVGGQPDWLFVKLHCHGMDPRDADVMLGEAACAFLSEIDEVSRSGNEFRMHFVSAREMVNIILAACDGREGDPGSFRDYRLRLISRS